MTSARAARSTPAPRYTFRMHRSTTIELPRGLILAASLWLVASWIASMGLRTPLQPSSASYTPGVRMMLICIVIGITIAWPLLRLSQSVPRFPLRQVLLDVIVLLSLVQIVLWPLRLVTTWSPSRTLVIDATIAGWAILAGAFVAAGSMASRSGPRILCMFACVGLVLLGPGLAWLAAIAGRDWMALAHVSPLLTISAITDPAAPPAAQLWPSVALLAAADGLAWAGLGVCTGLRSRSTGLLASDAIR